jgi:dUTP pyrophosphatase
MRISIKLLSDSAKVPEKMTEYSAGYDIYADLEGDIDLKPMDRALVPTGFAVAIPEGFEAQIRPRSGLAVKNGITVLNSPGTIDSDYRGEVKVVLINLGSESYLIKHGMRIAQMIVAKHETVEFDILDDIDETKRGVGGFGSSEV